MQLHLKSINTSNTLADTVNDWNLAIRKEINNCNNMNYRIKRLKMPVEAYFETGICGWLYFSNFLESKRTVPFLLRKEFENIKLILKNILIYSWDRAIIWSCSHMLVQLDRVKNICVMMQAVKMFGPQNI